MTANQFSRRTFLGGTAAGAGLLLGGSSLITACSGSTEPPPAAPLTAANFHLSWFDSVQFGGSYLADANGHYAANGLDVTLVPGGPGVSPDTSVIAGQSIMGISAANFAGQAWADGAPLKVVGVAMQRNPFVIASLTSNPVNEPKDLEGRRLGMAFNNQLDLELLSSLNGVDVNAIEVIQADYDPAPLVNGEVDCLLCWLVDLPVAMTVAGIDNTTMLFADFGYAVHSQTYIVTEETLATNRETVKSLLRGEILGWQDHRADPDTAAQVTVDRFPDAGMDLETETIKAHEFTKLMFSDVTDASGFLWWTDQSVADNIRVLKALGVNVTEDFWDRSLLAEIYADGPVLS